MRGDEQRAEELRSGRQVPALQKKEKVSPESPGSDLRRQEECVFSADLQAVTQHRREKRISREKRRVGYFHHFMADGRNDGLVAAVHDIGEPIAIVLHQCRVAIWKWAIG